MLQVLGLFHLLCDLATPLLHVVLVVGKLLLHCSVVGAGLQGQEVGGGTHLLLANLLGLVQVPLVSSAGLHQYGLGMCAVTQHGHHRNQYSENTDRQRDTAHSAFATLAHLFRELVHLSRFHGERILRERGGRWSSLLFHRCPQERGCASPVELILSGSRTAVAADKDTLSLRNHVDCDTMGE